MPSPAMRGPVHIVLQARVNSTRLPGKALLPLAGLPTAVLAAKRAARGPAAVTLATSDSASDTPLAAAALAAGIRVFRGPEQDVLGRFAGATQDLPDNAVIVRLTADNVFPDGDFVTLLTVALESSQADIVSTASAQGLPYGLSAEALRVSVLRRAAASADAAFDREHVTPWIYRTARSAAFNSLNGEMNLACLRCTLDIPDDYRTLTQVFETVSDPVAIGWRDLVARLAALPNAPRICVPANGRGGSTLILGTAQLGAPYGSVRKTHAPSPEQSTALVHAAIRHGITHIDTARAYPGSESRLGAALASGWSSRAQTITKLSLLEDVPMDASEATVRAAVEASISASCNALGLGALPVLLLHRATHLTAWGGLAWRRLLEFQREGVIGTLGASVQSVAEARLVLAVPDIRHVQLACNILDTRWDQVGIFARTARPDVTVHARGALLQGVLLANDVAAWPAIPGLDMTGISNWLERMAAKFARRDTADLCYAWLRAQNWIHATVVGMESEAQVIDNAALFARPPLEAEALAEIACTRPAIPPALLNPALWPLEAA
jgi:spore coat polysaccharide biosynthesis protein SpsF (cytidylyltransferase family)/aryl-alcohol dehydrogenase-like predicted oxidoreductase